MNKIYLNNYYLELSTGLKWKLVNIYNNEYKLQKLQNEDTTCYVTLGELEHDFKMIVLCGYCKHFKITDLGNDYIKCECNINEENTNINPCNHYEY